MDRKEAIQRAAEEARAASAETLTTHGTHSHLDDIPFIDLSYDEIAESAFIKGAEWADTHPKKISKGCKFCQGEAVKEWGCLGRSRKGRLKYGYKEVVEPVDFGETCSLTITGKTLNVDYNEYSCDSSFYDEIAINFCPMCGRKLNEVENNENK